MLILWSRILFFPNETFLLDAELGLYSTELGGFFIVDGGNK
jgi:hypothetical protein